MAVRPLNVPVRGRRRGAFTLIELAVVIVVVGIVAGLGAGIIVEAGRAYKKSGALTDNFADANYALTRLALELGNLASANDITAMGASSITFRLSGVARTFAKSGTNLLLGTKTLASGVSSFSLTYYDSAGAVTTDPASVRRIAAQITIDRNGSAISLQTGVFPRALRSTYLTWQEE